MIATAKTNTNVEPHVSRMTVTPTMAANWLENANINNRKIRETYARQLARDMAQGRWRLTHEAMAFDPHGVLLDGQHRLWGIVLADVPIEMHVWFNITSESLAVINGGKPRSLADQLRLSREHGQVTKNHTSVLNAMLGGMSGPSKMTTLEASEALGRHGDAVSFALSVIPNGRYIANATTRAVIGRAYYSADHQRLRDFGQMLVSGVVPDASATGVILLRQYLYSNPGDSYAARRDRYAKTERALLAFLKDEPITRLMAAKQELFPLPEEAKA